jgi:hypothetical protein
MYGTTIIKCLSINITDKRCQWKISIKHRESNPHVAQCHKCLSIDVTDSSPHHAHFSNLQPLHSSQQTYFKPSQCMVFDMHSVSHMLGEVCSMQLVTQCHLVQLLSLDLVTPSHHVSSCWMFCGMYSSDGYFSRVTTPTLHAQLRQPLTSVSVFLLRYLCFRSTRGYHQHALLINIFLSFPIHMGLAQAHMHKRCVM